MSDDLRRVRREIRDWTGRPPARSPRIARQRVLARIEAPRRGWRMGYGWLLAAATSIAAAVLAAGLLLRAPATPSEPPVIAAVEPAPSQREAGGTGLLVYQLASGTKLYLALAATTPVTDTDRRQP